MNTDRRGFLKFLGAAAATVPLGLAALKGSKPEPVKRKPITVERADWLNGVATTECTFGAIQFTTYDEAGIIDTRLPIE